MIRRNARLRREYIYRKSLEGKERMLYEKKRKVRECLEEGKPLPTELRAEEAELRRLIELEDENTAVLRTHVDDEYRNAGVKDPKVLMTTARDPSSRLMQFVKEMKLVVPNCERVNRGSMVLPQMVEMARRNDFTDIVVFHEHRGQPDGMVVCHLPHGPTAYFGLSNVVMRHDIKDRADLGTMSEAIPHIIMDSFASRLGERTSNILKHLFPAAKSDSKRIITFANKEDFISFRHHTYQMPKGAKSLQLFEVGPRFEMKLFQIRLGTIDSKEADNEYVLRPYQNVKKRAM